MTTLVNKEVVDTVTNILGQKASSATIAGSIQSASEGDVASASIGALQSLEAFASVIGKSVGWAGPGLLAASFSNNLADARKDYNEKGYVSDKTWLSLAGDAIAILGIAGVAAASGTAVAVGFVAVATVASAGLAVAAIAQNPNDDVYSAAFDELLLVSQQTAAQAGDSLTGFFRKIGVGLREGIELVANGMSSLGNVFGESFLRFALGLSDALTQVPSDLINGLQSKFTQATITRSPLVLDLNGDGMVSTVGQDAGVYFDHDGNGFAERTGWVNAEDGLLVRDVDGNGTIDNGSELFGSETLLRDGQKAANGYEALAELDGNQDGRIDQRDAAYTSLRVWKDINGDGVSSAGELFTLEEAGVRSIATGYANTEQADAHGNVIRQSSTFTRTDGSVAATADVWFTMNKARTVAVDWLPETEAVAALPNLRGVGKFVRSTSCIRSKARRTSGGRNWAVSSGHNRPRLTA